MEAKDRNNTQRQILEKYPGTIPDMDIDWDIGEIFFDAGIKEVVDWIMKQDVGDKSCVVITIDDWEAKLKEWGIEKPKNGLSVY